MKKLHKGATFAVAMLGLGSLVAGCGTNTGSNQASAPAPTTTTSTSKTVNFSNASGTIVWAAPPITHTGLRNTLIAEFEKQYPKIKVVLQNQSNSTNTNSASLSTAIGGGSSTPDVYMGDVIWPAQFAHAQLALPLSTILPSSFWSRFTNGLVQGATYKGQIYAAPFFADSGFLYYRKDLLQKAHLPVPTTWAQLKQEAQQLQKQGLVKYGFVWQGASYEGLTCDFTEYLADAGGSVLNAQGQPTIDSSQALKALTFMRGLITSGVSPNSEDTFKESQSMAVFDQGNAAFLRNWTYAWANSQNPSDSQVVGKVGVTVLPSFNGGSGYSSVGGWNLYVNPHSKNVAADLAFINWMTGKQAQTTLAVKYSELPTNASVATDPATQNASPVFKLTSKMHFVSRPDQTPNYPQISQALYSNVNAALSGTVSPSKALQDAQQQMKQAVSTSGGL